MEFTGIARSISILDRLMRMYYDKRLTDVELSWGQMFPLEAVASHPGIAPQDLAVALHVDRAAITKSVRGLLKQEFIEIDPDSSDRRSYHIFTTQKGREALTIVEEVHGEFMRTITAGMDSEEIEQIERELKRMVLNLAGCVTHSRMRGSSEHERPTRDVIEGAVSGLEVSND